MNHNCLGVIDVLIIISVQGDEVTVGSLCKALANYFQYRFNSSFKSKIDCLYLNRKSILMLYLFR